LNTNTRRANRKKERFCQLSSFKGLLYQKVLPYRYIQTLKAWINKPSYFRFALQMCYKENKEKGFISETLSVPAP